MTIEIQAKINNVPVEKIWEMYTNPKHIVNWNFASDGWECPHAENNLVTGGRFSYRMAAKDNSMEFDFEGKFTAIEQYTLLAYSLFDDRRVQVHFSLINDTSTKVTVTFDPDTNHDEEYQKMGWQSILNNFKEYAESNHGV